MEGENPYVSIEQGDLTVNDGVTIGGDLYVDGTSYLGNAEIAGILLENSSGTFSTDIYPDGMFL